MKAAINRVLLLGWLLLMVPAAAQPPKPAPVQPPAGQNDTAPARVRYPDPARLNDLRNARDYQYDRDAQPPKNMLARAWRWFWDKIRQFMRSRAYQNVWQYVVLAVIAGLAVWLLRKAEVLNFLFPRKAESPPLDYENLTENIHDISFADRIEEAVSERHYRLAVRLLYLQTLKQLTDRNLIHWQADKTNRQYVQELSNTNLRPDFEQLTTRFEFVWYGDFPIDEADFLTIQDAFTQFEKAKMSQPPGVRA